MDTSMESFHVDGVKCGALVRRRTPREVRTLICFRADAELYRSDSRLEHSGSPRDWTRYTFSDADRRTTLTRSDGRVVVDGAGLEVPDDTVPSYAGPALLEDMLADSATEVEFHLLSEADPTEPPHPAHYSVGNPEGLTLPCGRTDELGIVELFVDEQVVQTFWFDSHEIVASGWSPSARSYRVETADELVDGLDEDIVEVVRAFCG